MQVVASRRASALGDEARTDNSAESMAWALPIRPSGNLRFGRAVSVKNERTSEWAHMKYLQTSSRQLRDSVVRQADLRHSSGSTHSSGQP